jgi:NAD(P)-dependent dehydrogenase (short-subunit alcohol dehydrogenase family)
VTPPLESQSLEELTTVGQTNLVAVLDLCRLAASLLFESAGARVFNIASIYGLVASRGPMAAYNATKGAMRGIRVSAIAPGYFPSEMTGGLLDPSFVQSIEDRTLLRRAPTIDELDGPLLFLASGASSYVTGQTIAVDGGWTSV